MRQSPSALRMPIGAYVRGAVALSWTASVAMCLFYLALGNSLTDSSFQWNWILSFLIAAVGAAAVTAVPLINDRAQRLVEQTVRNRLLTRVLTADTVLARAALPATGRIVSTGFDGAAKVAALRGGFVASIIAAGTAPLIALVVVATTVSWVLAGLLFVLVLLAPVTVGGFQRLFRRSAADYRTQSRRLAGEFLEALRGLRTVSLLGRTDQQAAHLADESELQRRTVMRLLLGNQIVLLVTDIVFYGGVVGTAAAVGVHLGTSGELPLGRALTLVLLALLLTAPIDYIGQFFYIGMTGAAAQREAAALIGTDDDSDRSATPVMPATVQTPVSCAVRDVDFTYPGRLPLLSATTIAVAAGETVVLTGPSGGGKSTLLALLSGDLRPDAGTVEFDGVVADPRAFVTAMHQNTYLFSGSVADNLRLAAPVASDTDLWEVLDRAHLADEIRCLPNGLDTEVGEFGTSLSGGQAQRLSLARALLRRTPMLVLDEVTSHVDARSEALIADTLASLAGNTTLVIATHSAGLLALADRTIEIGATT
ncbi:ABC transporter ATP-binding protein [Rhodococcus sp. ABRD24]|uniref:ATP-binding cassette domain-containing protein n=1 Tax=Rhodococcus sp. ABRD24 TaxID=2507582 RepID=UPI0013F14975|nr:ABC transporter ATP-binding protein [Rhodococcus sp. ABRD24]